MTRGWVTDLRVVRLLSRDFADEGLSGAFCCRPAPAGAGLVSFTERLECGSDWSC